MVRVDLVNGAIYLVNGIIALPVLIFFLFGVGMVRFFTSLRF
jgi:hypothetical protein